MTRQELLNEIARRSRAGLFPSRSAETSKCRYRGPGGRRCFAGLAIPDEKYTPSLEGHSVWSHDVALVLDPELQFSIADWGQLQGVHDRQPANPARWDHDKVMAEVLALPFFAGMAVTEGVT